ncbi:MAG: ABC transporter substrate-binding protein [Candidatus Rokubacteria bacterium]|nr:ABC transporter substrate-binding protein [Candidatus Rokubacteria bacterium]
MSERREMRIAGGRAFTFIALFVSGMMVAAAPAAPRPLKKVVLVFASANLPVGTSPQTSLPKMLGYWEEEGLDVELQGAAGSLPSLQMIVGGKGDIGVVQPLTLFQMRPRGAEIRAFYTFVRQNWFFPAVLADGPIRSIRDFKGKRIGVQSLGASMIPFMKLVVADAGLDPENDVSFVGVGLGAGAAALLQQRKVDVLGLWSAQYALMENAGFNLRKFVDVSPIRDLSFAVTFVATDAWLRNNPEIAVGVGRGLAKASVFALHNPTAAVRLHWKMFPQTRPAGESDVEALRKALHELEAALAFMRIDTTTDKRWGATTREEIEAYANVLLRSGLLDRSPGRPEQYYTNEFLERINAFDEAKIIDQARRYSL